MMLDKSRFLRGWSRCGCDLACIGSTDIRGLHQLVYEVIDNSVDKASAIAFWGTMARCVPRTTVRGIPVKAHPKMPSKSTTLEIVMTTLHAGGKFGGDRYKQGLSGLHGVGALSAVNAQLLLRVHTCRGSARQ